MVPPGIAESSVHEKQDDQILHTLVESVLQDFERDIPKIIAETPYGWRQVRLETRKRELRLNRMRARGRETTKERLRTGRRLVEEFLTARDVILSQNAATWGADIDTGSLVEREEEIPSGIDIDRPLIEKMPPINRDNGKRTDLSLVPQGDFPYVDRTTISGSDFSHSLALPSPWGGVSIRLSVRSGLRLLAKDDELTRTLLEAVERTVRNLAPDNVREADIGLRKRVTAHGVTSLLVRLKMENVNPRELLQAERDLREPFRETVKGFLPLVTGQRERQFRDMLDAIGVMTLYDIPEQEPSLKRYFDSIDADISTLSDYSKVKRELMGV